MLVLLLTGFTPLLLLGTATDTLAHTRKAPAAQRVVRNYIRPSFSFNSYGTGVQPLLPVRRFSQSVNDSLKDFRTAEHQLSFIAPLYTHTAFGRKDSNDVNTFHLLFTASAVRIVPRFSGLAHQHVLSRTGVSLRAMYGFRSKFVLFYDASPFVVSDLYRGERISKSRFATTLILNWMVGPEFSLRGGFTRTYRLGNRRILPTFGVRIGRLDGKVYFTAQYPRFAALYYQPTAKLTFSAYSRAYGSLFSINNGDSLYSGGDKSIYFGQLGLANGLRMDFRANSNFSCFASAGYSQNRVALFSESFNNTLSGTEQLRPFYYGRMTEPAFFLHFGITVRFGRSKTVTGNYLLYDVFELNNTNDAVDGNNLPGNSDIPPRNSKAEAQKIQYNDVQDLISDSDFY